MGLKVAIIHDWLTSMRGGEKVLEVLCELYPSARLYTLLHVKGSVSGTIEGMDIRTSFVQRLPFAKKKYRYYLPLFPVAIEQFDLRGYDLVISTSHCVAKGVIPPPDALHICYIHSPMRYVWDLYGDYFGGDRAGWFSKKAIGLFANYLRMWDVNSSNRVDHFLANSMHVARKVEKYYRRKALVIHAPVDCNKFYLSEARGDYYLIVSAFAPYKRIDIAIEAFNRMGLKLKIIGSGQDETRLRRMAGPNIEFLGWKKGAVLREYYARCKSLIFPGEEDFGIVPVEAMASGRPVIAYARGGLLETVVPLGEPQQGPPTGVFFHEQSPGALIEAVRLFNKNRERFDPESIRAHALQFDKQIFREKIHNYIEEIYKGSTGVLNAEKVQPIF